MSRTQYVMELDSVRQNLVRMGETAVSLLGEALRAIVEPNPASFGESQRTRITDRSSASADPRPVPQPDYPPSSSGQGRTSGYRRSGCDC